ncbi:MAG TPA: Flp family type IVb pilin [Acidobacteriaceae bacterium]|nr:Flp family type IVb pilin [Acidobacteriaceae bacterium]
MTVKKAQQLVVKFMREESGQDNIEYGLLAALIALAVVGAMSSLANHVGNEFNSIDSSL